MIHDPPTRTGFAARWGPAALVLVLFLAYSAVQAPVPGINEPQYLGKAKHFQDATWAAGDYFLDSSNPHLVFYVAVGWLTGFLSLAVTAWVARVAGYAVLAVGWTLLAGRLSPSRWAAVPAAAVFLLCASIGNLSGEWIVGGIEGKVFAYGLLFAAIAFRLDGRSTLAAACLGGSVSFHPVVGMWGLLCGAAAEIVSLLRERILRRDGTPLVDDARRLAIPAIVFLATALPGLTAAVLSLGGVSPEAAARATYMQVFIRLRHHLDPTQFSPVRYFGYGVMLVVWLAATCLLLRRSDEPARRAHRWFAAFVLASVAAALAGVAIGWHSGSAWTMPLRDVRGALLKFYPFRLADVFIPLALATTVAAIVVRLSPREDGRWWMATATGLAVTAAAFAGSIAIVSPDRNPSRMPPARLAAWIDVARWVRDETPPGSVIVTPSRQWGFRWYAARAEYVNFKDAPQDAAGLLEWERRQAVLKTWWESSEDGFYAEADLQRLGEATGADYLVTRAASKRFHATPVYRNRGYRVYAL